MMKIIIKLEKLPRNIPLNTYILIKSKKLRKLSKLTYNRVNSSLPTIQALTKEVMRQALT